MKNNNLYIGAAVLSMALVAAGIGSLVYAAPGQQEGVQAGCDQSQQRGENKEAMKEALANQDYDAWAELMANHPNADELINEETFNKMLEAHALFEAGETEAAQAIMEELGMRPNRGQGNGQGRPGQNRPNGEAMREALTNQDYSAWAELLANHPNADELINEDNFNKMVEAHQLIEAGDTEAGRAIMEELGLGPKGNKGQGQQGQNRFKNRPNGEAIKNSLENQNYQAWSELMKNHPRADELVNEETFYKLVQAHQLIQAGELDAAQAIFEELGMGGPRQNR